MHTCTNIAFNGIANNDKIQNKRTYLIYDDLSFIIKAVHGHLKTLKQSAGMYVHANKLMIYYVDVYAYYSLLKYCDSKRILIIGI